MIKCNVGGTDIIARYILGLVLLFVALAGHISLIWQIFALSLSAVAMITATRRYCPINALLGLNSCSKRIEHKEHPST